MHERAVLDRRGAEDIRIVDVTSDKEMAEEAVRRAKEQAKRHEEEQKSRLGTIDIDEVEQPENIGEKDDKGNEILPIASQQPSRTIQRLSDGRLRTQESINVRENPDGSETHRLKLGSVGTSDRYGVVEYTLDGSRITIDSIRTRPGYESIASDAVKELGRRYEGYDIIWSPETEFQKKIKQSLVDSNPRGADKGLNWYESITDTDAAIKLSQRIQDAFTNLNKDESTVAAQILQMAANAQGKTLNQWLTDNAASFQKKELGAGRKGGIELSRTESGIKATITAAKGADFSTFAHEAFHLIRNTTNQSGNLADALREASAADEFKTYIKEHQSVIHMSPEEASMALESFSDDGTWTTEQEELAATLFESYLRDNATLSPKLKNLFEKIRDWFVRIYRSIRNTVKMDERIAKAFDSLLDADPEQRIASKKSSTEGMLYQSAQDSDATEARLRADPRNFDPEGNHLAPNGRKSNLSYEQWVQVRTPAFKRWFGDWERPARLEALARSKALDISDNGMTKEIAESVYRKIGTVRNLNTGDEVRFVNSAFGKISRHKDYDPRLIGAIEELFRGSELIALEEPDFDTPRNDGSLHKIQGNIESYSYYLNKVRFDGNDYLIRYTVQDLKHKPWKSQEHQLHTQQLSDIEIGSDASNVSTSLMWAEKVIASDSRLADALQKINDDFSKVVDENGEPMVTFHGSEADFDVFDDSQGYVNTYRENPSHGYMFADDICAAADYGDARGFFLRIADPADFRSKESLLDIAAESFSDFNDSTDEVYFEDEDDARGKFGRVIEDDGRLFSETGGLPLREAEAMWHLLQDKLYETASAEGNDGFIINDSTRGEEHVSFCAFEPNQIKSATGNSGEFNPDNPSILFQSEVNEEMNKRIDALQEADAAKTNQAIIEITKQTPEAFQAVGMPDLPISVLAHKLAEGLYLSSGQKSGHADALTKENLKEVLNNIANPYLIFAGSQKNSVAAIYSIIAEDKNPMLVSLLASREMPDQTIVNRITSVYGKDVASMARWIEKGRLLYHDDTIEPPVILQRLQLPSALQAAPNTNIIHKSDIVNKYSYGNDMLYQTGDPKQELIDEAMTFQTLSEFKAYSKAMLDFDDEAELEEAWEKAHPKEKPIITEGMSDDDKDDAFIGLIETDKGLDDFVKNMRDLSSFKWMVDTRRIRGWYEGDQEQYELAQRVEQEASPFINAIAKSSKELTGKSKKAIRSMIRNNARMYRDLYGAVINDPTFKAVQYDEFLPDIKEPAVSRLSIMDRKRLSEKIEAEGLKQRILSGKETFQGEAEKVIRQLDADISRLEDELKAAETVQSRLKDSLSFSRTDILKMHDKVEDAKAALDKANRLIRSKLDNGARVSPEEITKRTKMQEKLELLEKQISDYNEQNKEERKQLRIKATIAKHEAIRKLKADIAEKERAMRQARAVRSYKESLAAEITAKPSNAINFEHAQKINAIRSLVDPHFRASWIRYHGKKYSMADFRAFVESSENPLELTEYQTTRLTRKPLGEWTLEELEDSLPHMRGGVSE